MSPSEAQYLVEQVSDLACDLVCSTIAVVDGDSSQATAAHAALVSLRMRLDELASYLGDVGAGRSRDEP